MRVGNILDGLIYGSRLGKVPFIPQLAKSDCGAACLAMVLAYHGRFVPLDELRELVGGGPNGVSALGILAAAGTHGLRGRGISLQAEELSLLKPATILHWRPSHFVVFQALRGKTAVIIDPSTGHRNVPLEECASEFGGAALLFEPTESFRVRGRLASPAGRYLRAILGQSRLLWQLVLTSLIVQLIGLSVPVLTALVVDRVVPARDRGLLFVLGTAALGLVLFYFLTTFLRARLLLRLRTDLNERMTLGFLEHLFSLPFAFFQSRRAGDLLMRMNSNSIVREILSSAVISTAIDGLFVLWYLGLLFQASLRLAILALAIGSIYGIVFVLTRRRQHLLINENLAREATSQSVQAELLVGIETIKSMGAERDALDRCSQAFAGVLKSYAARGKLEALADSLSAAVRFSAPLLLLCFGTPLVLSGQLSLGTMLAMNALAIAFLVPLASLFGTATDLQRIGSYLDKLEDVFSTAPEQPAALRQHHQVRGQISTAGISFRYSAGRQPAIQDLSIEIQPGEQVAIVGPSGAGKSTLGRLLIGVYSPGSGRVLLDGRDLRELDIRGVRRQLGIVTQTPDLFADTIAHNIALAADGVTTQDIVAAARMAQIHEEIVALPMGYDTQLIDRGASLSVGQRQRLALARALVRRPRVLLLDEATSALDAATESRVYGSLSGMRCTRIVIAHRLSTVARSDRIFVLDAGALVEQGTHAELLAQHGLYVALFAAQLSLESDDSVDVKRATS